MRIVLVEDNAGLAKGISYRLEDAGHAVDILDDGLQADAHLQSDGGDVVILDINLPGLDGLSLLRRMRERGDQRPVILLTARSGTEELVQGLDSGADDYLAKPFAMAELEARVRALARRKPREIRDSLRLGPLELDLGSRQIEIDGDPQTFPRREVSVLELLLSAEGRTVSKADLLDHTYGVGADVEESAIEVLISRLRKRLRPHGLAIRVQRGLGYSLSPEEPAP
ncbi:response regulator transcription factor [Pseudoponticoccus marisrubri]|uniref:Two-component system response regulator n=1 Tax=Pseudoponticoccus marisrubri TaxID=1685382 RepID=A0A0W7WKT2_9RHOB|nr:response regulator transcription factor [Pseudoponticoccus marisrubri]KUF11142.1 two-component system response regulator [Pseudoponticoccus marisrubri]